MITNDPDNKVLIVLHKISHILRDGNQISIHMDNNEVIILTGETETNAIDDFEKFKQQLSK